MLETLFLISIGIFFTIYVIQVGLFIYLVMSDEYPRSEVLKALRIKTKLQFFCYFIPGFMMLKVLRVMWKRLWQTLKELE